MERLGLGYEALAPLHRGWSLRDFGLRSDRPRRSEPGYDAVMQGEAG